MAHEIKTVSEEYLKVIKEDFKKYKLLGDKTFIQINDKDFHFKSDEEANSIAVIIQHLSGNMSSRFTDFLTTDGEKPARQRDQEFEEQNLSKEKLIEKWENGWKIVFNTLNVLSENDLNKIVKIRNEPHSVIQALNRQVTHCAYHVGQIVLIAKQIKKSDWNTLSIAKKKSEDFNKEMFSKDTK
jgi:Protein of unknown function (DUF1572)